MSLSENQVDATLWDSRSYEIALSQLHELHAQLNSLRSELPDFIDVLSRPHPGPDSLYHDFERSATRIHRAIAEFQTSYRQSNIVEAISRAKQSRQQNPNEDFLPVARGWEMVMPINGVHDEQDDDLVLIGSNETNGEAASLQDVIGQLRAEHSDLDISFDHSSNTATVRVSFKPTPLTFHVRSSDEDSGGVSQFEVTCKGDRPLHQSIERCCKSRPRPTDGRMTLDMVVSYRSDGSPTCVRCNRVIDKSGLIPTARRLAQLGSHSKAPWQAFHEGCLSG